MSNDKYAFLPATEGDAVVIYQENCNDDDEVFVPPTFMILKPIAWAIEKDDDLKLVTAHPLFPGELEVNGYGVIQPNGSVLASFGYLYSSVDAYQKDRTRIDERFFKGSQKIKKEKNEI